MPETDSWAAGFTRSVAGQIHRHRKARGWSAQRLSDACAELGMEFPRTTLADLETGRRGHISVAELLVLARALDVPPLLLMFPVGTEAETEVLPGQSRPAFRAAQWFTGEGSFPGPDDADTVIPADPQNCGAAWPLALYRARDRVFEEEMRAMAHAKNMDERAAASATDAEREAFTAAATAQRLVAEGFRMRGEQLREEAREQGIVPPGLIMKLLKADS